MKVLAVVNAKGGVGKTTSAIALAQILASEHGPTTLVDLDPQGSATSWAQQASDDGRPLAVRLVQLGSEHRPAALPRLAREAAEGSEWLVVDTSPADLDRADAAIELVAAVGGVVVVPTKTSGLDLPRAVVTVQDVGERAKAVVLLTMTRSGTVRLRDAREALIEYGCSVLSAEAPLRESLAAAAEGESQPMAELVAAYKAVAEELTEVVQ